MNDTHKFYVALVFAIVLLLIGVIFLFWPAKVQEYFLKDADKGLGKYNPFLKSMKTRWYNVETRIIGASMIGASIFLFWVLFQMWQQLAR